jgi:hypothetical protein
MIGLVVNGEPPNFSPRSLNASQLLFECRIQMRKGESHICLFLTKPLPSSTVGVAVFVSFDGSPTRDYAGFLSNQIASRIFRIAGEYLLLQFCFLLFFFCYCFECSTFFKIYEDIHIPAY